MNARRSNANRHEHHMQDARDRCDLAAGRHDVLFARYWDAIHGAVRSVNLWNEADRQDAVQMACERLLKEWQRGKEYRVPIRVVILTVAMWTARGVKQRATIHVQRTVTDEGIERHAAADPYAELELVDWMESLFENLPPREREVMYLRYIEGMPPSHVAALIGIEPNAENQAHFRAVKAIRLAEAA